MIIYPQRTASGHRRPARRIAADIDDSAAMMAGGLIDAYHHRHTRLIPLVFPKAGTLYF